MVVLTRYLGDEDYLPPEVLQTDTRRAYEIDENTPQLNT